MSLAAVNVIRVVGLFCLLGFLFSNRNVLSVKHCAPNGCQLHMEYLSAWNALESIEALESISGM